MGIPKVDWIWINGEYVPWNDAKIHILSHVIHYGTCVFEGIRCYNTKNGPAVMRLKEHIQRLYNSAKIYRMDPKMPLDEFCETCLEVIRRNKIDECYIRPIVYRGYGDIGVNPLNNPVDLSIAVWEWGAYLGPEALAKGVDVCVATWSRCAPNTLPMMAKAAANYMNGGLIKMEAILNGYAEGIALDVNGNVSEGSGENIFVIKDGAVVTPPLGCAILPGITRQCAKTILTEELGIEVIEQHVNREMLYLADEIFFTGTAAEITPIATVDKIAIGSGARGPITEKVQTRYLEYVKGEREDKYGWLTPVNP